MKRRREFLTTLIIALLLALPFIGAAQDNAEKSAPQIITLEPSKKVTITSPAGLLPEKLGGLKASSETLQRQAENLNELVAEQAAIYQEYRVIAAAARTYGNLRVEAFQMETPDSAFGAFTFHARDTLSKTPAKEIGSNSAALADAVIFWKQNYFIRVTNAATGRPVSTLHSSVAAEVAKNISANDEPVERPSLLNSLPKNQVARSERYFLGAESLSTYFERGRDIFSFDGDAIATIAEYRKADASANQAGAAEPKTSTKHPPAAILSASKPLKLVIVEYHTPQFATQADAQATAYLASLSEAEQSRIIVKRIGNFLVGASSFEDREFAEQLINSIEYPYVVKWLQNPAIPTRDPFHEQKVAQVILSSFSLVGVAGVIMMTGGFIVGTAIFLRRRKQSREIFSDAGGMLRLQLDPIEDIILGLPPKRSDE